MRSALVHYWLTSQRGGEVVLEALGEVFPESDLFAHRIDPNALFGSLEPMRTNETFIGRLPFAEKNFRMYLPLMPLALEALDMSPYELIISSESGPAKWIIPDPDCFHLCYCHSPLRYIWDQRHIYRREIPKILTPAYDYIGSRLRSRDAESALRIDQFVANSSFVARRINKYYRREATIVHPPISTSEYTTSEQVEDFYLFAGETRGYKRLDIAVEACRIANRRLVVAGNATDSVRKEFDFDWVEFKGRVATSELRRLMSTCRALLFPGVEDFGIIPVEVMASGRPVIAFDKGGARDSISHGESGLLYQNNSPSGLATAIAELESELDNFSASRCTKWAYQFDRSFFIEKIGLIVSEGLKNIR